MDVLVIEGRGRGRGREREGWYAECLDRTDAQKKMGGGELEDGNVY